VALTHGIQEHFDFCVSTDDMAAYRRVSGDTNPLHHDIAFAHSRGFKGAVVYGGLIIAQISGLLGTRLPGPGCVWRALTINFKNPLYVGERARLTASIAHRNDDLGFLELDLSVDVGTKHIAEGRSSALLLADRVHA
jgi:3-hydroxybutyryl-CoA dehydratase